MSVSFKDDVCTVSEELAAAPPPEPRSGPHEYEHVAAPDALHRPGPRLLVTHSSGRHVALLRTPDGATRAIDATCYHMGGPLLRGDIEDMPGFGDCVVCPWHAYPISLVTGESVYKALGGELCSKGVKQRVHRVECRENGIYLQLVDGSVPGALAKVDSDAYAFRKPAPALQSRGAPRSGEILQRNRTEDGRRDILKSMTGADGAAPWANR